MNAEVEVVVTGVGAVTCHGVGAGELWRAMTAAGTRLPDRSADPLALMDLPLINLVPDLDLPGLDLPGLDLTSERATRFASLAAAEALADAGLDADALDAVRSAVVLGSCMGEPGVNERGGADSGGSRRSGSRARSPMNWGCSVRPSTSPTPVPPGGTPSGSPWTWCVPVRPMS